METNTLLGVLFHWIGGLAAASFYIPYRGVKRWSWETYWLVGGFFSWIVAPWALASLLVGDLLGILHAAPTASLAKSYTLGALWGVGGLTFGLTMRYLGIALGYAVALGLCAAFGTLLPPILAGTFGSLVAERPGQIVLLGIVLCLVGMTFSGVAGHSKEKELSEQQKKAAVKEFNFTKGLIVALLCGLMSACFALGLDEGKPIAELTRERLVAAGKSDIWQGLPVLIVVMFGGFTTNFLWCVTLNIANRSGGEYLNLRRRIVAEIAAIEANSTRVGDHCEGTLTSDLNASNETALLLSNYLFAALAGITWYLQFFFYSMGSSRMGPYEFSSWTMHMASIIIFSTFWGFALREWKGTSKRTYVFIGIGLTILIASTIVVGYGNFLKGSGISH